MAEPVGWAAGGLQEVSYPAIDDTQTIVGHRIYDFALPNPSQTSDYADGSSTDAQSLLDARSHMIQVSDGSSVSADMILTTSDPTGSTDGETSKPHQTAIEPFSIDPQLLLQAPSSPHCSDVLKKSYQSDGNRAGSWQLKNLASSASSLAPGRNSQSEMPEPNTFDYAFRELEIETCIAEFVFWLARRSKRVLSAQELSNLKILAQTPGWHLMDWLKKYMSFTSKFITASTDPRAIRIQHAHIIRPYFPRCLDSNDRSCQKRVRSRDPKVFECTNHCGQSFPRRRKGDWIRHERVNFEDWICPECNRSLRRRHRLCNHLKESHGMEGTSLDQYRRQFLAPSERPCGFCPAMFHDWSAWLHHVGVHFEGSDQSQRKTISEWTERRNAQTDNNSDPQFSIKRNGSADNRDGEYNFGVDNVKDGAAVDVTSSINQPLDQMDNNGVYGTPASRFKLLHETSSDSSGCGTSPPSLGNQQTLSQHIYPKLVAADRSRDASVQDSSPEDPKMRSQHACKEDVVTDYVHGYTAPHSCAEYQDMPHHKYEEPVVSNLPFGDKMPQTCTEDRKTQSPHVYEQPDVTDHCPDGATSHSCTEDQRNPFQNSHTKHFDIDYSSTDEMPSLFPEDRQSRFQHIRTEPLGTPIDHDLVHRMANLNVSETGIENYPFNWATASDISCSCTSCEQRLHLGTPAVDALPRAMNWQGGCRKIFIQQSYHIQRYVQMSSRQDCWSSEARMVYNIKSVRRRSHL